MARRGIFGRVPRAAPDLTNTIVSLVREANAMEDTNYVDAWKNGGKVDGKGVDDSRLLDHMKMRRDQLSKDDPAWDEWDNRVAQYDFSINESKVNLKFDQKKMTEQQVADFYGKWVARPEIQQDSEFYRHLLDQQAKWHQAAVQGNANSGRAAAAEAHNKWVSGILKDKIQPASDATSYILQIAKEYDAAPDTATSLDQVFENSKGWGRVMDIIDDGKSDDPYIQGLINQATAKIQGQMGKDWKWNKNSISALMDGADSGYKTLIHGSKTPTEKGKWTKDKHNNDYEQARVRHAEASKDVADAADHWADDLDNCNGDAYCARVATKTYLDRLKRNAPNIIGGQSGVAPGTEDTAQSQMLIATIGQLTDIVGGKPVQTTTGAAARMIGAAGGGSPGEAKDLTQADAIVGNKTPTDFIGNMGNMMNEDIRKLDNGGWVESVPNVDPQTGAPTLDGDRNPTYHLVTHDATEVPDPGLVPIKGGITMNDPTRVATADPGPDGAKPHTATPVQWVSVTPVPVVTVTEGGDPVSGDTVVGTKMVNGKPDPAATPQTKPAAGYSAVTGVIGPDGNPHTLYRTGDGSKGNEFRYMTAPPVEVGTKTQRDPKTGAMVPVLTAHPVTGPDGKTGLVYDTSPLTSGIDKATRPLASGNLPLGTFKTTGAATTAQAINAAFANGNSPDAIAKANHLLATYTRNVGNLPANDPDRINSANDLNQLSQTVQLHAGGKFGQTVDDNYSTNNDRTPAQMAYEKQLEAGGIVEGKNGITRDEVGRRITLLENIDAAEGRVRDRADLNKTLYSTDPAADLKGRMGQTDLDALTKAKTDILNPTISVSNIKVPGFAPIMQNAPPITTGPGYAADVAAHGLGYVPPPGNTPYPAPVAPPTPHISQGPPVTGAKAGGGDTGLDTVSPTPPKPLMTGVQPGTGKAADDATLPTPALPTLSAAAELRRQKEAKNQHGALEF